jgi:WD40 repeat protein
MEKTGLTRRCHPGRLRQLGGWLLVLSASAALVAVAGASRGVHEAGPEEDRPFGQRACDDQQSPIWSLAFSPDGTELASATVSGEVWLKDLRGRPRELLQRGQTGSAPSLAFAPDRRALAIGVLGPSVRILDPASGNDLEPLRPDGVNNARLVAFSRDGRRMAAGGFGSIVTVWDWDRRRRLGAVHGHRGGITALAFSPDGATLATGDPTGVVQLTDIATGKPRARLAAHSPGHGVTTLAYSHDGTLVATASYLEPAVRLWGAVDGVSRGRLPASRHGVRALAFSPVDALLALAREDGTAVLWGIPEGRALGTVRANYRGLQAIAFSADGRALATGGTDGRVRVWDLEQVLGPSSPAPDGVDPPDPARRTGRHGQ